MNTATITVDQARRAVDRLHAKVDAYQSASYMRGVEISRGTDDIAERAAIDADENAKLDCYDELARVRELIVGLIAERDRAAGAA